MTYVESLRRWCALTSERWLAGDGAGAWAALARARELVAGDGDGPGDDAGSGAAPTALIEVEAAHAVLALRAERFDEARAAAERCLALAAGAPATSPAVATAVAHARVTRGTLATAAPAQTADWCAGVAELREVARTTGDPAVVARAVNNALIAQITALEPGLGRRDPAAVVDAWLAVNDAHGATADPHVRGVIARQAADLAFRTGLWERGWDHVVGHVEVEPERAERVALHAKAALLAWHRGDDAAARDHGTRALRTSVAVDVVWVRLYAHLGGVVAAAAGAGSLAAALRAYARAVPRADHARRPGRAWEAAQVALDAGADVGLVDDLLDATGALPLLRPAPAHLAALVLADRRGEVTDAVVGAVTEADLEWLGAVDEARALRVRAAHRARTGRRTAAAVDLARARAALRSWPGRLLDAVEAAALAAAPPVTPGQARVLDLLVEGMSNEAVARELGLSTRTVAVHVSRLLRATGATSRTELVVGELCRRLG